MPLNSETTNGQDWREGEEQITNKPPNQDKSRRQFFGEERRSTEPNNPEIKILADKIAADRKLVAEINELDIELIGEIIEQLIGERTKEEQAEWVLAMITDSASRLRELGFITKTLDYGDDRLIVQALNNHGLSLGEEYYLRSGEEEW